MSATNFGQNWPSSWTTDATLTGSTVAGGANATSAAVLNTAASPNEVLDTECDLSILAGSTITNGPATIYILRQTQAGYQAITDTNVYSFTSTLIASTTTHAVFVVPGADVGGFKIAIANPSSNSSLTVTLYYRQSQGQSG